MAQNVMIHDDIKNIDIKCVIDEYIKEKTAIGRFSPATARNRINILNRMERHFLRFNVIKTGDIHKNILVDFVNSLKLSKSTKKVVIDSIVSFFDFMVTNEYIVDNYAAKLEKPKAVARVEQPVLYENGINDLYEQIYDTAPERWIERDELLCSLILNTAIRVGELVRLRLDDVDLANRILKVKRKGGKVAYLPFSGQIHDILQVWLEKRASYQPASDTLFIGRGNQPLGIRGVQHTVHKYLKRAGQVKANMGPHLLRRTAATDLAQRTDLKTVQEILGHSNITTTAIYVKTTLDRMKKAVEGQTLPTRDLYRSIE